jgi:L-cystine uptake protein TcyP (sodium:dicarboxylate symporter family)
MTLTLTIFIVSLLWLLMGSTINSLQKIWLTEPMIALLTGIIVGPLLHLIQIPESQEHNILEWGAINDCHGPHGLGLKVQTQLSGQP